MKDRERTYRDFWEELPSSEQTKYPSPDEVFKSLVAPAPSVRPTTHAPDGAKADPIPGTIWVWDHARPLYWQEYLHWQKNVLPLGWSIIRAPEEGAKPPRR